MKSPRAGARKSGGRHRAEPSRKADGKSKASAERKEQASPDRAAASRRKEQASPDRTTASKRKKGAGPKHGQRVSRSAAVVKWVLVGLVLALLVVLGRVMQWGVDEWGNISIEEIAYTLRAPLEGTGDIVWRRLSTYLAPALGVFVVAFVALLAATRRGTALRKVATALLVVLVVGYFGWNFQAAWNKFEVGSYVQGQNSYSNFAEEHYADPKTVQVGFPDKKQNLIYIYLESMEVTFSDTQDGGAQSKDIIPELTKIALDNECFAGDSGKVNGAEVAYGTSWTMGGIFGQSSGLPLKLEEESGAMEVQQSFFPGVTTVGDILHDNGYRNVFLCGSDARFGGRRLFFETHGDFDIHDYTYALAEGLVPQGYHVWWGLEDAKLFEFARAEVEELSKGDEPFNLTMLTVDTHPEDGYKCADCPHNFGDQYANVFACSSKRVAEFVEWVQDQPYGDDITIVLVGDHTTMDADFCDNVDSDYTRKVYATILNPQAEDASDEMRAFNSYDMFPTTLAALGATIEGEKLALGTNLFSGERTLVEEFGNNEMSKELRKQSALLNDLQTLDTSALQQVKAEPIGNRNRYKVSWINVPDSDDVESLSIGLWKDEAQEDLIWLPAQRMGKGDWMTLFDLDEQDREPGTYYASAWITYKDGSQGGSSSLQVEVG